MMEYGIKMPQRQFWLITGGFFIVTLVFFMALLMSSYRIGFDLQKLTGEPSCLPSFLFIMDMKVEKQPTRGDYVVALMPDTKMGIGAPAETKIVKIVAAVPGDHIKISGTELYINNFHRESERLWLAKSIPGKKIGDFDSDYILKNGEYFLMGSTKESFDSRYWGVINIDSIIGYARPLL